MSHVLAIAGFSGSGKTTLITALLPELANYGWRVNVIKHSHHDLEFEPPHKDSARFRSAGAGEVMVVSPYRYAIFHELAQAEIPTLSEQIARLAPADLTLVEGFKREAIPKIEVWRADNGKPPLFPDDEYVMAIATDTPDLLPACQLPRLDLNDVAALARFILQYFSEKADA
ncbi:molybdopterin-guanine dinucleotide biosynthesis protein B [Chitinibacter sp. GC72]|uniref:molybdopterin-guanine dinucleotide biosynthesis protein B n=1 Tax=Chitinibacter sp. GC72 TaxID=1526917 RepID=UPI0012FA8490|nr:molybdopterin-guanine dinucleotide biosynthesis protein B [Chitinibacter sp. GC72]